MSSSQAGRLTAWPRHGPRFALRLPYTPTVFSLIPMACVSSAQAFRSVIRIIATALLSLTTCSFVPVLQVQT